LQDFYQANIKETMYLYIVS